MWYRWREGDHQWPTERRIQYDSICFVRVSLLIFAKGIEREVQSEITGIIVAKELTEAGSWALLWERNWGPTGDED